MQCIVVKSDEFENSSPPYLFLLNPDYDAARSLRSLRSNNNIRVLVNLIFHASLQLGVCLKCI